MIAKVPNTTVATSLGIDNGATMATPLYRRSRYFFVFMAFLFLIVSVIGFVPSYKAMHAGKLDVHWFVHVHGVLMAGWLGVFLTQTILAAKGNLKSHRQLGLFSFVLGVLVWFSMGIVSFNALIGFPPRMDNIPWDALSLQLMAMNLFGLFFAWGIIVRKKNAAAHKRLLFLATLVLLLAAIGRIEWLPTLGIGFPSRIFLYLDILLISLFIYDLGTLGRIHKITWMGSAYLIVAQVTVMMFWGSAG